METGGGGEKIFKLFLRGPQTDGLTDGPRRREAGGRDAHPRKQSCGLEGRERVRRGV